MAIRKHIFFFILSVFMMMYTSCSISRLAVDSLADMLAGSGGTVFTGDEDPELVGDALPFALKLYESLLSASPENDELLLTAGTGFISYSNIYVHSPSDMLPQAEYRKQKEMRFRAKRLYLRGRDYILRGLDVRHPGFLEALESGNFEAAFEGCTPEDVPFLYWASAGWLSAVAFDILDAELMITIPSAFALAVKALSLDETWGQGSIHELFISVYGSVPESLLFRPVVPEDGDSLRLFLEEYYAPVLGSAAVPLSEKARFHYKRAVSLSEGLKSSPHLSYAMAFGKKQEKPDQFIILLERALAVDPEASPENRLANIANKQKAEWLLENLDNFFLLETDDEW